MGWDHRQPYPGILFLALSYLIPGGGGGRAPILGRRRLPSFRASTSFRADDQKEQQRSVGEVGGDVEEASLRPPTSRLSNVATWWWCSSFPSSFSASSIFLAPRFLPTYLHPLSGFLPSFSASTSLKSEEEEVVCAGRSGWEGRKRRTAKEGRKKWRKMQARKGDRTAAMPLFVFSHVYPTRCFVSNLQAWSLASFTAKEWANGTISKTAS